MDALREYLAWQAEMGGDEVMIAAPRAASQTTHAAPRPGPRPDSGPVPVPDRPGNPEAQSLFSMLSQSLQDSQETAKAARRISASPAMPGAPGIVPAAPPAERPDAALQLAGGLPACREYLERNGRALFTGDVQGATWRFVHGTGPESAPLALVGLEASPADGLAGLPFQGPAGLLLEKMMRAIRLDFSALYRTVVVKLAAPGPGRRCYTRRDLVKLLPLLHAELEAARVPVVLLLGEACAQAVLKTGRGLEELRQAPHRLDGVAGREFAVTYHPDELEGNEDLKRKAWKDLQWLQARLQGS